MENVDSVETLVWAKKTDLAPTEQFVKYPEKLVFRVIHKELQLKCLKNKQAQDLTDANKIARLVRTKQLLRKYLQRLVQFLWFTDEKLLH